MPSKSDDVGGGIEPRDVVLIMAVLAVGLLLSLENMGVIA